MSEGVQITADEATLLVDQRFLIAVEAVMNQGGTFRVNDSFSDVDIDPDSCKSITLLPPPLPEEPTGLGAVVDVVWATSKFSFVRVTVECDVDWYHVDDQRLVDWEYITTDWPGPFTLTVLSPGIEAKQ